jgi:ATP-binding cassette, subfamily B, bacterial PglK
MRDLWKIFGVFSPKEKRLLFLALTVMIVSGLIDMVGIVSLVPFLTAIADIENVEKVWYLNWLYDYFGFKDIKLFLVFLAGISFSFLVANNTVRIGTNWLTYHVAAELWHGLHVQTFKFYLEQPFSFYLHRNSSELNDKLMNRVNALVAGLIIPALLIVTNGLTGLLILLMLLWQNFSLTMILIGILSVFYVTVYINVCHKMEEAGEYKSRLSPAMLKLASESFGGIKEIKTLGREMSFWKRFNSSSKKYMDADLRFTLLMSIPQGLVEVMAIGTILLIGGYLIMTNNDLNSILPLIGIYVLGSRRIQPAMQIVFAQVGQMRHFHPSVEMIWPDIDGAYALRSRQTDAVRDGGHAPFEGDIEVRNVDYIYDNSTTKVISGLNMTIPALSTVGIVGGSGVGKTTLVDLILGLLQPTAGEILIDGRAVNDSWKAEWCRHIGYVPQHVFLSDDTILHNIAFGIDPDEIDREVVYKAAKLAQIHDFIEEELPQQYDTAIGERGIRLSGGQRQRLGIARALYHDPEILVLDEATSALDGVTEQDFMRAVQGLSDNKTIIIIAHRLTTIKNCDRIFLLESGGGVVEGRYEDLLGKSELFASMAGETVGSASNDNR